MADHYIERKNGRQEVTYLHPKMEEILYDTYGIILYQEQIMQLARSLAGYSLAEADLLRRAMGKKIPEEMRKQRSRFVEGAIERGIDKKDADEIFAQMETFARYGFNRSHSAAYALISFQTAYLKAHYPVEFMAALMSHEMEDSDKVLKNFNECRKAKIDVLPPDVNQSVADFSVSGKSIRYGLSAVKGVGGKAVAAIVESREEGGHFKDLEDFAERVDLRVINKRVLENLIKCGGFDFSGDSRRSMFERLEDVMRYGQSLQKEEDKNQISLFGVESAQRGIPRRGADLPEWPVNKRLAFEREAIGFYISGHPLEKHRAVLRRMGTLTTVEARSKPDKSQARIGGVITALKLKNTKKGDRYASCLFEDSYGTLDSLIWPDVYRQVSHMLVADEPVMAKGRLDVRDERATFIVEGLESLIDLRDRNARHGVLTFRDDDPFEEKLDLLVEIFQRYHGTCPIKVNLHLNGERVTVALRDQKQAPVCVQPSEDLCDEIEQIFGKPVLSFV